MKNAMKIAAIIAALCFAATMTAGCRNEKQITNDLDIIKSASEKLVEKSAGEIMLYETFKLEEDIEGVAVSNVTQSYVKYAMNGDSREYDLTTTTTRDSDNSVSSYSANFEKGVFTQKLDGKEISKEEHPEPDIFKPFEITVTPADVKNIDTIDQGLSGILYVVTTTKAFADSFDYDKDGVKYDCTDVKFNYYVDSRGMLNQIVSERTATITTADKKSQKSVNFFQVIAQ